MDNILLDVLVEAAKEEKKNGRKWDNSVCKDVISALSTTSKDQVKSMHLENRLRQMRNDYLNFVLLKKKSGASMDRVTRTIILPDGVWDDIMANPKDKKNFGAFKERGLKWDFDKLVIVMGNYHATGSYSLGGLDDMESIDLEKNTDDIDGANESSVEDGDEGTSVSTKSLKRQHGKRSRTLDEMKDLLIGVNSNLEKLRESVDPLTFAKQLREAIKGIIGFSDKFSNAAFKLLMKDRVEVEVFMVLDEEGRKDTLEGLRGQIGFI